MREYDLGIIVPLREEFRVLEQLFPVIASEIHEAVHYYDLQPSDSECRVVAVVLGGMGNSRASHVTERMLTRVKLKAIVLLGLAGALDKDLRLGDVVVADEINEFQAAAKVVPKGNSFVFQYSGDHWKADFALKECAGHFEFSARNLYDAWRSQVSGFRNSLGLRPEQLVLANDLPGIKVGHIASGDVVGASEEYAVELRGIDRKFLALEMEAAGVAQAAHARREPIPIMVVRGVSDFADERKRALDAVGNGAWRTYAMYSASAFVLNLLKAQSFQEAIVHSAPLEREFSSYFETLSRHLDCARWADRPCVREEGEDHYIQTESKILPLHVSPYDDDAGQQRENLVKIIRTHDRLLILGEPGVGKTTALKRMIWEIARAQGSVIPIYVPLSYYGGDMMSEVQEALVGTGALHFSGDQDLNTFLRQNQCLVLFDGLNEVQRDHRKRIVKDIESFVQDYRQHRYVVTSRSQDLLWRTLRDRKVIPFAVVVQPISDAQIREYLIAHLGDQEGKETHDGLSEPLRGMSQTPLFLWMLKEVRQAGGEVPGNRGELFDRFVETVFTRDEQKLDVAIPRPAKKKALAYLACTLQQHSRVSCQEEEAVTIVSEAGEEYDPQTIIHEALVHGLLKKKERKGEQQVRFMHQAMQEYFVALSLCDMVATEIDTSDWQQAGKRVLRRGLVAQVKDDRWAECFVQLAGLTEYPSWLVQMVVKVNPWLAFWCMVEGRQVDEETQRIVEADTVGLLRSDDVRRRQRAVRELSKLKNPRTAEYLADALGDEAEEVVRAAVQGLGKLGEPAVKHLLPRLDSDDVGVRRAATRALGRAWQLPYLEDLGDADASMRLAALKALRRLGDTRTVEAVVATACGDTDGTVRQLAIETLGGLGDKRAIGPLRAVLHDDDPSLRASTALTLGQLGDERAAESLAEALKDDDELVRRRAISALGRIWELPPLVRLGDDGEAVRGRAASALGRRGDMRAVQPLIATLRDRDEAVCANAAMSLGYLGNVQAVEPLVSVLLTREEPTARMRATEALGRLGDRRAVGPLIVALEDQERNVRWSAVKALGGLRAEQAIASLLEMFEDQDMQDMVATALAQIGRPATLSLMAALKEGEREVRTGAARALGQIGGTHALEALLISLREDKDRVVRVSAAMALGQIGGSRPLKRWLAS